MKIFISGTSFYPEYGGPAYSVARLAVELANAGAEVGLWAPDGSALDSSLIDEHPGVTRLAGAASEALESFGRPDLIHDNGLWLRHNHQIARLAAAAGIPRMVTTHGMLAPWAINHKRWKKRLAWWLYQKRDLQGAVALHATARSEADHLRQMGLRNAISIIPNGVDLV